MSARPVAWVVAAVLGLTAAWTCVRRPSASGTRGEPPAAARRAKPVETSPTLVAGAPTGGASPAVRDPVDDPAAARPTDGAPRQPGTPSGADAPATPAVEEPAAPRVSVTDVVGWDRARVDAELPTLWQAFSAIERGKLMTALHGAMHAGLLIALDLGMRDEDAAIRRSAEVLLSGVACDDFRGDPDRYEQWRAGIQASTLDGVVAASARLGLERLTRLASRPSQPDPESVAESRLEFGRLEWGLAKAMEHPATRREVLATGVLERLEEWITRGNEVKAETAMYFVGVLDPGEEWVKRVVVPLIQEPGDGDRRLAAIRASNVPWALQYVAPCLRDTNSLVVREAAQSLGWSGNPAAAVELIAALRFHESQGRGRAVGRLIHQGLEALSDVPRESYRDSNWWFEWWERNRTRFE